MNKLRYDQLQPQTQGFGKGPGQDFDKGVEHN